MAQKSYYLIRILFPIFILMNNVWLEGYQHPRLEVLLEDNSQIYVYLIVDYLMYLI